MSAKQGALTVADLLAIWQSSVDPSYGDPIVAAGDGKGLEVYNQSFAQLARVSQAIDTTTQAQFILPWSGQTAPPAGDAQNATVALTFSRAAFLDRPVRLAAGEVFAEEVTTDWGATGGVSVRTGRRYTLTTDVVFMPGDSGPHTVTAIAEFAGWGFNNPLPGTISLVSQAGSGFYHDRATLALNAPVAATKPPPSYAPVLTTVDEADTFSAEHVGQYIVFTAGANLEKTARVVAFAPPVTTIPVPVGSAVGLEMLAAVESLSGAAIAFGANEIVSIKSGVTVVGWGQYVAQAPGSKAGAVRYAFVLLTGAIASGYTLVGVAGSANVDVVLYDPKLTAEAPALSGLGGASWRVLDWTADLGIAVSNAVSPTGGQLSWLDEIAHGRGMRRGADETADAFRKRIAKVADTTSPNAIVRAIIRSIGSFPFCFREVGTSLLPGFYYDRVGDANGDFYDDDVIVFGGALTSGVFVDPTAASGFQEVVEFRDVHGNLKARGRFGRLTGGGVFTFIRTQFRGQGSIISPVVLAAGDVVVGLTSGAIYTPASVASTPSVNARRNHVMLDYTDFRAYFRVGVPRVAFGDFGFSYDNHPTGFFDAAPYPNFFDGFPAGNAAFYQRIFANVDSVRAGGTTWDLYLEDGACA